MTPQAFLDFFGPDVGKRFRKGVLPVVDLFSGLGGASTGLLAATRELGLDVQLAAVNHWDVAIATHTLNHPEHLHFETQVDRVNIDDLLSESDSDSLFALWGSPSCTTFSSARGGVPINPQERSGCWALVKWLRSKKAIHLFVENVSQFLDYGPLTQKRDKNGNLVFLRKDSKGQWLECLHTEKQRPKGVSTSSWLKGIEAKYKLKPAMIQDKEKKGIYFIKWVKAIRRLGYDVEWRVLNAADFGAPTKRLRLFVQGVRRSSGRKIVWPNSTHAEPDANGMVPVGLAPWRTSREIIDWTNLGPSIYGRKKPLSDKTIDRIAVGLIKFGLDSAIVKLKGTGTANSVDDPLGTVQAGGLHYGLMTPQTLGVIIPQQRGGPGELRVKSVDTPLGTITGAGAEALASMIVGVGGPTGSARPQPTTIPLGTVIGENHRGIVSAFIVGAGGPARAGEPVTVDKPMGTILSRQSKALVSPEIEQQAAFLVPNFGERPTQTPRTHSVDAPLPVITSHGAGGLVTGEFGSFLVVSNHGNGPEGDKANLRRAKSLDRPLDTVTGSNSLALVSGGTLEAIEAEEPTEITDWRSLSAAIKVGVERAKKDPNYRPIVVFKGVVLRLEIRFRMLGYRELSNAQSFPASYKFTGNDSEKVKQIGNAVPPNVAFALAYAALSQKPDIISATLALAA